MKKTLLTLAFLSGFGLAGFSQDNSVKNKILNEIDSTRVFEKYKYEKFCINTYRNLGYLIKEYDSNSNKIPDLCAAFEIIDESKGILTTKDFAEMVLVDEDEKAKVSTKYDIVYSDNDMNGTLENKERCW